MSYMMRALLDTVKRRRRVINAGSLWQETQAAVAMRDTTERTAHLVLIAQDADRAVKKMRDPADPQLLVVADAVLTVAIAQLRADRTPLAESFQQVADSLSSSLLHMQGTHLYDRDAAQRLVAELNG